MGKVYVIGSVNSDLVIHAPYIPQSGETLTGDGFFISRGGKGANQAVAASRAGADVKMCACVGDDVFGMDAVQALINERIDVCAVRKDSKKPTGTAVIVIVNGDNRIILDWGANSSMREEDVETALKSAKVGDILLTQLENPPEIIGYAIRRAKEKGMFVVLNPAPAKPEIEPYLKDCDLIIPNETEAEILGGREKLSKTNREMIVTLGGDGYEVYHDGNKKHYPCLKVKVEDTTAAGDTFCGTLCARLAMGESLDAGAQYAATAASLACTKKGAQNSIPYSYEIEEFLKNQKRGN